MSTDRTIHPSRHHPRGVRAVLAALGLLVMLAVAMPGAAGATNLFTLDSSPAGPAEVAVDQSGAGYFGWVHSPGGGASDQAMFCKVARGGTCSSPIILPGGPGDSGDTDGAFPVLGSGSTVYVVGPRFIEQDVVIWTSTDAGITFGAPVLESSNGVSAGSDPTDVLAAPSGGFYLSSHNPGLTFTSTDASGGGTAPVTDLTPPGGSTNLSGSALGLAGGGPTGNPVEAFSLLTSPQTVSFRSYSGTGSTSDASSWNAPSQVSQGTLPSLAGGPSGLFLASQDLDPAGQDNQVNVRKYTPGSGFGTPVATLQTDTSTDNSGQILQTAGGRLLVAWQGPPRADGGVAIRLYESTTGGTSFTRVGDIAEGTPFVGITDFRLAAANDGQGFLTFNEISGAGLRVADLKPIMPATASVHVTGIALAGDSIIIKAGFDTSGALLVTSRVANVQALFPPGPPTRAAHASAAEETKRCMTGQALIKAGNRKECFSSSFGMAAKAIPAAGSYKIKLSPNAAARKAVSKGRALHVTVTLTFKPKAGGKPAVRTEKITVKGKKHR